MTTLTLDNVDYMDEKDTAKKLGLSKHTLRAWRQKGDVGPRWVKWHSRILYSVSAVEHYTKHHLKTAEHGGIL